MAGLELVVDEVQMKCLPRDSRAAGERNRMHFRSGERNLTRNVNCTAHKRGHRCITRGRDGGRDGYGERIYFHGLRRIPLVQCKWWAPCSEAGVHFAFKRSDKSNQSSVSLVRLNPPRLASQDHSSPLLSPPPLSLFSPLFHSPSIHPLL